jgi:hypothetical protein
MLYVRLLFIVFLIELLDTTSYHSVTHGLQVGPVISNLPIPSSLNDSFYNNISFICTMSNPWNLPRDNFTMIHEYLTGRRFFVYLS